MDLVCPLCHGALDDAIRCNDCGKTFPRLYGAIDFAPDEHYDRYTPSDALTEPHKEGLALEVEGSRRRIADFYLPQLRAAAPDARRVLDSGCGNGISVEVLAAAGYEAWGNDLSELRAWQWRERTVADRLVVANSLRLPFADGYFDAVISSGVIEHIGVVESAVPTYGVTPLPDRDARRVAFLREMRRVLKPGGILFLDCPNGAFPIDFWHGNAPGRPRFHSTAEGFLPTFRELRRAAETAMPGCSVRPVSPYKRLQFRQAAHHVYGRVLAPVGDLFFRAMAAPPLRWLAATRANPFLVVRIETPAAHIIAA